MKKPFIIITLTMLIMSMATCNNSGKSDNAQADAQATKDSITNNAEDTPLQSETDTNQPSSESAIREVAEDFLKQYIASGSIKRYTSQRFQDLVNRWDKSDMHEPWSLMWNIGSTVSPVAYSIIGVHDVTDKSAVVKFKFDISDEEEKITKEAFTAYMTCHDGKWLIDDFSDSHDPDRYSALLSSQN